MPSLRNNYSIFFHTTALNTSKMNASELFIKCLENEDVKYIFGVPGEENEDFLFALENSPIQFVPTRHEQGAAFMANMWGRLTGRAGVCLSTLGPGATNLMTGIADANLDKAPLVAITGQGNLDRLHHESHQVINIIEMMKPITKWNSSVRDSKVIPEIVRKAFKKAEEEKPGATHIELSEDIAGKEIKKEITPLRRIAVKRSSIQNSKLIEASNYIEAASKPLIIAGNGAIRSSACAALTRFSIEKNIPVVTTFMGKGAISDKEATALGPVGLGFKDYVVEAISESDLIICIGYDIAEYDPISWNPDEDKNIIHLDFEAAEVFRHYIPMLEINADPRSSINQLHETLNNYKAKAWFTSHRHRIKKSINQYQISDADKATVPGILHIIRELLPDDGLLISDVGSHKMWIARNYQTYVPNGCIISNGLASMGIALPGGIAASLIAPEKPIIALMGDGGAMMNIQELETAKRLGVGCTFIITNDDNYGLIEWKQQMSAGKSTGTKLGNPDFKKLAESFDINGYYASNAGELKDILKKTITANELSVVEVPVDTSVNQHLVNELEQYFENK